MDHGRSNLKDPIHHTSDRLYTLSANSGTISNTTSSYSVYEDAAYTGTHPATLNVPIYGQSGTGSDRGTSQTSLVSVGA